MKAWKSQENWHFTGGKFENFTGNYVIICKFTGVARIYRLCEIQICVDRASTSKVFWRFWGFLVRFLRVESLWHLTDKNIFISSAFLNGFQQCYADMCSVRRLFIYPGFYIVYVVKGTLCDIGYFAKRRLSNRVFCLCFWTRPPDSFYLRPILRSTAFLRFWTCIYICRLPNSHTARSMALTRLLRSDLRF